MSPISLAKISDMTENRFKEEFNPEHPNEYQQIKKLYEELQLSGAKASQLDGWWYSVDLKTDLRTDSGLNNTSENEDHLFNEEFDLLKMGDGKLINIELKEVLNLHNWTSDELEDKCRKTREACKKQIIKRFKLLAHPLRCQLKVQENIIDFLKNHLFCYGICFEGGTPVCYQVKDENTVFVSFGEIVQSLPTTTSWIKEKDVKQFFSRGNLLVSPLTEEWQHGLYVLSDLENTREKELIRSLTNTETSQDKKPYWIIGDAGTGKTLLLFDVAKEMGNGQQDRAVIFSPQTKTESNYGNYICMVPTTWLEFESWRNLLSSGINYYPQFNFTQPPEGTVLKYVYIQNILCREGRELFIKGCKELSKQASILRAQITRETADMNDKELKKYIYLNLFLPFFKDFKYIFVDEAQLLDSSVYNWLLNLNNEGKNIIFCTDPYQTFTGECCKEIYDEVRKSDGKSDLQHYYLGEEIRQKKKSIIFVINLEKFL